MPVFIGSGGTVGLPSSISVGQHSTTTETKHNREAPSDLTLARPVLASDASARAQPSQSQEGETDFAKFLANSGRAPSGPSPSEASLFFEMQLKTEKASELREFQIAQQYYSQRSLLRVQPEIFEGLSNAPATLDRRF